LPNDLDEDIEHRPDEMDHGTAELIS